jgi:NADH-quinone oxidoreductase subunit J
MFSTSLFFISFSSFWILSSIAVISSNNPVYSVLFLVLSFFNATGNLLLLQVDFITLSFIVIYVGAIAVLFLFVIMMLNIKLVELINTSISFYPFLMVFTFSLMWQLLIGYQFNTTDLL